MRHSHPETALALSTLLFMLTACRQEPLSLPVAHAAASEPQPVAEILPRPKLLRTTHATHKNYAPPPGVSCYSFIPRRPKNQRADAVQARLEQADKMAAALDEQIVTVDIVGDHANVLSLEFPVSWPPPQSYSDHLSAVIEEYFASPDIEDYMCGSGFAEVTLSARGLNDGQLHPFWKARVTSEGLLKVKATAHGEQLVAADPLPLH